MTLASLLPGSLFFAPPPDGDLPSNALGIPGPLPTILSQLSQTFNVQPNNAVMLRQSSSEGLKGYLTDRHDLLSRVGFGLHACKKYISVL